MNLAQHKDIEAEKALLGACMEHKDCILTVFDDIEPNDFYNTRHRYIYEGIIELFAKGSEISNISVSGWLKEHKNLEIDAYLLDCLEIAGSPEYSKTYRQIVKEKSKIRKYLIALEKSKKIDLTQPIDEQILQTQEMLLELSSLKADRDVDFFTEINKADELLEKRLNGEKKIVGYKWSADQLTEISGGIERPYVYVFGALKKTGKSKFIIDQLHSLYEQGVPTMFLSLEMGKSQITRWLWSRFAEVDSMKIRYPVTPDNMRNLSNGDLGKLKEAKEKIERLGEKMIINTEAFLDFNKIRAKVYQAIQKLDIEVVCLDHLQRCNIPNLKGQNAAKAIEEFVFRLADMAKEYNVAMIILSQLQNIAEGEYATIKHLKHSGGIGEGVDFIGVMNRESRIKKVDSNKIKIGCWQRDGRSGEIEIECDLAVGKFADHIKESPF